MAFPRGVRSSVMVVVVMVEVLGCTKIQLKIFVIVLSYVYGGYLESSPLP